MNKQELKEEETQKIVITCIGNMEKADIIKDVTFISFEDMTNISKLVEDDNDSKLWRDVMAGEPPYIFVKHIYASASVVGAMVCVYMYRSFGVVVSMIASSAVILLIRYLAAHYHWNLPHIEFKGK